MASSDSAAKSSSNFAGPNSYTNIVYSFSPGPILKVKEISIDTLTLSFVGTSLILTINKAYRCIISNRVLSDNSSYSSVSTKTAVHTRSHNSIMCTPFLRECDDSRRHIKLTNTAATRRCHYNSDRNRVVRVSSLEDLK